MYTTSILVIDGNRHMQATGYGQLARSILLSLLRYSKYNVFVQKRRIGWDDVPHKQELLQIPESDETNADFVLRLGVPHLFKKSNVPTLFYTQNALGELRHDWVDWLQAADAIIVPGLFDLKVFNKYLKKVFICHQNVDETIFKPVLKYRSEYPSVQRFLFVGSFSFRKGVDILFQSFSKAFDSGQEIDLSLHCFSGLQKNGINYLLQFSRDLPRNIKLNVFNGTCSPAWMNRIYNQHDVVVSLSRGEGWCMPLHEALLCEKPVMAPNSTAMGEVLPIDGVCRVGVEELKIANINSNFGSAFVTQYGDNGNFLWEPNLEASIEGLRDIYSNFEFYGLGAKRARSFIIQNYSLSKMSENLSFVIESVLKK